jgi:hypothetical protein
MSDDDISWLDKRLHGGLLGGRAVTFDAPADTDALVWDETEQTWRPGAGGGGGGGGGGPDFTGETVICDALAFAASGVAAAGEIRGGTVFALKTLDGASDRQLAGWASNTLTLGNMSSPMAVEATTITIDPAAVIVHKPGSFVATTGNFRLGHGAWSMVARNSTDATNQNIIRSNSSPNSLIFGDTAGWGAFTIQGPSISLVSGGVSASLGTTGIVITGASALLSQFQWAATAVTPTIAIVQQADANPGEPLTVTAQAGGTSGAQNGGQLRLRGGAQNSTGLKGGVALGLNGTAENMVECGEVATGRRVVAVALGAAVTATEMPASSGDRVIYIANAATVPAANASGGGILYCEGGALKYRGSGGTITTLGPA